MCVLYTGLHVCALAHVCSVISHGTGGTLGVIGWLFFFVWSVLRRIVWWQSARNVAMLLTDYRYTHTHTDTLIRSGCQCQWVCFPNRSVAVRSTRISIAYKYALARIDLVRSKAKAFNTPRGPPPPQKTYPPTIASRESKRSAIILSTHYYGCAHGLAPTVRAQDLRSRRKSHHHHEEHPAQRTQRKLAYALARARSLHIFEYVCRRRVMRDWRDAGGGSDDVVVVVTSPGADALFGCPIRAATVAHSCRPPRFYRIIRPRPGIAGTGGRGGGAIGFG